MTTEFAMEFDDIKTALQRRGLKFAPDEPSLLIRRCSERGYAVHLVSRGERSLPAGYMPALGGYTFFEEVDTFERVLKHIYLMLDQSIPGEIGEAGILLYGGWL